MKIKHYNDCVVLRTGPKNIIYRTPNGFNLTSAYAEILEIVKAEETIKTTHPFKVGEEFTVSTLRAGAWVPDTWEIIKATNATVTLKNHATGKTVNRKPRIGWTSSGEKWKISVGEYSTDICKDIEEK